MIEKFFALFHNNAVHKLALIASVSSQVIRTIDQEFPPESEGRSDAIDELIELLKKHKTTKVPSK